MTSSAKASVHHPPASRFCDVEFLLDGTPRERQHSLRALANFEKEFGRDHLGPSGISVTI